LLAVFGERVGKEATDELDQDEFWGKGCSSSQQSRSKRSQMRCVGEKSNFELCPEGFAKKL